MSRKHLQIEFSHLSSYYTDPPESIKLADSLQNYSMHGFCLLKAHILFFVKHCHSDTFAIEP